MPAPALIELSDETGRLRWRLRPEGALVEVDLSGETRSYRDVEIHRVPALLGELVTVELPGPEVLTVMVPPVDLNEGGVAELTSYAVRIRPRRPVGREGQRAEYEIVALDGSARETSSAGRKRHLVGATSSEVPTGLIEFVQTDPDIDLLRVLGPETSPSALAVVMSEERATALRERFPELTIELDAPLGLSLNGVA